MKRREFLQLTAATTALAVASPITINITRPTRVFLTREEIEDRQISELWVAQHSGVFDAQRYGYWVNC